MYNTGTFLPTKVPHITCAEGFNSTNGTCYPSCEWSQNGRAYAVTLRVILLLSALLAVLASLTLFVVSFIRYKNMYETEIL